ncbi:MAG TPA: ABC transporter permease, partial [Micrococcaceae bacterium]|nr:ABC transporter permease [Micrococcaceae bacterium]
MTQIQDKPLAAGRKAKSAGRLGRPSMFSMLLRDKFATVAAALLGVVILIAIFGPALMGELATKQNLMFMNKPPFDPANGWAYVLGSDSLGRSMLARLVVATQ